MVDIDNVVARNLRAEMARRQVTHAQLGTVLGITGAAVSSRLKGRSSWPVRDLALVASVLGVDLSVLMTEQRESA